MKHTKLWMLVAILLFCGAEQAKAQTSVGEWYSSSFVGLNVSTFAGDIPDTRWRPGFQAQTEIGYNITDRIAASVGFGYSYMGVNDKYGDENLYMNLLNVPITLNFHVFKGLVFRAGLQPDFMLRAWKNDFRYNRYLKTVSLSVPLALSYEFYQDYDGDLWFVELRYNCGVTPMNKYSDRSDGWITNGTARASSIQLCVGYKFDM
jgi:hypothetical protein